MPSPPDPKLIRRLDRLDAVTERLLDAMSLADRRALGRPPVEGAWTPLETLHHLCLAERHSVDYLLYKFGREAVMPRLGVRECVGGKAASLALASPFKFAAPPQTDARREGVAGPDDLQSVADASRAIRTDLRELIRQLPEGWRGRAVYRHPRVGRMSLADMLRFFAVHQRRHGKQIRRALAQNARHYRRQEAG